MSPEQFACHVDGAAVGIFVTPNADRVVVFQCKTQRVNLFVAAATICSFAVHRQSLSQRLVFCMPVVTFVKRRNVSGRWIRWIVENHSRNPSSTRDRLSAFRARGHCHHGGVRDHSSAATVGDRDAMKTNVADRCATFTLSCQGFTAKRPVRILQQQ